MRRPGPPVEVTRRRFLGGVVAAAAGITVTTAGQTVPWLSRADVLGPRRPGRGTGLHRLPVNRTAGGAGVTAAAQDPAYTVVVDGAVSHPLTLSLADLARAGRHSADLPLTCVEGWSVGARWSGLRLRDLLSQAGAAPDAEVRVESLERGGRYRTSHLDSGFAWSPATLLATHVEGERLDLDHGYPLRVVAPDRPGVLQTKWLRRVVVL